MTKLQHFLTTKLLQNLPAAFLNNKTTPWQTSTFLTHGKLLHDQPSTFLNNKATTEPTSRNTEQRNYYMPNLQHFLPAKPLHDQPSTFLTTKLLHDQSSTFLYSKTTT